MPVTSDILRLKEEIDGLRGRLDLLTMAVNSLSAAPASPSHSPSHSASTNSSNIPLYVPLGHYYSPVPDLNEIRPHEGRVFRTGTRSFEGIDLRETQQMELVKQLKKYYDEQPFTEHKTEGRRYYYHNDAYCYSDGVFLYGMMRHLKPRRYLEVGSGYSSALAMDVNDLFFDGRIQLTFVEPYPDRLLANMRETDHARVRLIEARLQDADIAPFLQLEAGDILFVDSTHVSRVDSDVNRMIFEILPAVAAGVYIHFHDIFYPFEYPKPWVYEGRAWNEIYLLHAFLQYNSQFEVVLFNTFLDHFHRDYFEKHMPLCTVNPGGSLWLHKR